jgi:class 3 adenylate cyclase
MPTTRNLTIMFTDIVGYTERIASQSRAVHAALLQEHDRLLQPLIRRCSGTLVKSMGDGLLVSFRSSTGALRCAMALQDALAAYNRTQPEERRLQIRIGLASGDVQLHQNDVFGEAVSIASRIESITPAGQIYFSAAVFLAMNKAEVSAELVGSRDLKGISALVEVYRVLPSSPDGTFLPAGSEQDEHKPRPRYARWSAVLALVLVVPLLWLAVSFWHGDMPDRNPPADSGPLPGSADRATPSVPAVATDDPQARIHAIENLLQQGNVDGAQQVLRDVLNDQDASAMILLAQGHLAFAHKHRETGADTYRKALELNPALADNRLLAENLVSALGWKTKLASELLKRYASPAMIDALARRTAQAGYWGRRHASQLLETLGHGDLVQRVDAALLDLSEGEDCERRRAAVRTLGELRNPRALKVLRPLSQMSLLDRFRSPDACLVEGARAAVAQIEAAGKAPQ